MEKLAELRKYLSDYPPKKKDTATNSSVVAAAFVITALDEIAWLFNMRGSDIVYNP